MDVSRLSTRYRVRLLTKDDIPAIYALCKENPLYYKHCPPFVTEESIIEDMEALPPRKTMEDKYYIGYFDGEKLTAVMDLIMAYPNESTAFIGFFMTDKGTQGQGTGSAIITELCRALAELGAKSVRLGWVDGNPQAEHFWHKNGFRETGIQYDAGDYLVTVAQRELNQCMQ